MKQIYMKQQKWTYQIYLETKGTQLVSQGNGFKSHLKVINLKISGFSLLDIFKNSSIIITYVIVIVQVLTNRCKSKFKTENYQVFIIWLIIRSTRDHFFKKIF